MTGALPNREDPGMAHDCENCKWRQKSEAYPNSFMAKIWRWHTTWCPGWKAYQKSLNESDARS